MPENQRRGDSDSRMAEKPRARGGKADARGNPEKQKENQRALGVGPEHKTPAMKKGHRGTFP